MFEPETISHEWNCIFSSVWEWQDKTSYTWNEDWFCPTALNHWRYAWMIQHCRAKSVQQKPDGFPLNSNTVLMCLCGKRRCSDVFVHVNVCFIPVDILRCCSGYVPVKPEQPLGELPASPCRLRKHGGATEQGFFRSPVCVTQEKWMRVTYFHCNQVRISDQYVKEHTTLSSKLLWMDLRWVYNIQYFNLHDDNKKKLKKNSLWNYFYSETDDKFHK